MGQRLFPGPRQGTKPEVLFITCSDAHAAPNALVEGGYGEAIICSCSGNIVPPPEEPDSELSASIEYALVAGVERIVVLGHYGCLVLKALLYRQWSAVARKLTYWSGREVFCS